jgi:uncharacterized protein YybS (DUF2232 family)
MAGVGLGAIAIVVQFLLIGTVDVEQIAESFRQMGAQGEQQMIPAEQARDIVQMFVLLMFAMIYLFIMVIIFIARWMQASLAETSGFGEEFRRLALGKNAALFALAILGLGFWLQQGWLVSLLYLLVVAFMFQGIAVVHSKVRQRRQARLILGVFYFLLLIAPQAVALTALTGVIDNWLVFRKQAAKPDNDSDE